MLNARPADRCSLGADGGNSSSLNAGHDASDRRQRTTPQKTKIMMTPNLKLSSLDSFMRARKNIYRRLGLENSKVLPSDPRIEIARLQVEKLHKAWGDFWVKHWAKKGVAI